MEWNEGAQGGVGDGGDGGACHGESKKSHVLQKQIDGVRWKNQWPQGYVVMHWSISEEAVPSRGREAQVKQD